MTALPAELQREPPRLQEDVSAADENFLLRRVLFVRRGRLRFEGAAAVRQTPQRAPGVLRASLSADPEKEMRFRIAGQIAQQQMSGRAA